MVVRVRSCTVTNPANGEVIASVPFMGERETKDAISSAYDAFTRMHKQELEQLITLEQGKPLREAIAADRKVIYAANFIEYFAEEAKRVYGDIIPSPYTDRRLFALKQPVGVVAAIIPRNYPLAMITRKAGPALACGCTVAIKLSELTPLTAVAAVELAIQSESHQYGVLNIVMGDAPSIGKALLESMQVMKITFTGSTAVGKKLMAGAAETVKKVIYAANFIEYFAEEAKRVYGDIIPSPYTDRRLFVLKQPVGVVAAIIPRNYPLAMITRKGVLNIVMGDAPSIGKALLESMQVMKITFTGSTAGKEIDGWCSRDCQKGKPMVVFLSLLQRSDHHDSQTTIDGTSLHCLPATSTGTLRTGKPMVVFLSLLQRSDHHDSQTTIDVNVLFHQALPYTVFQPQALELCAQKVAAASGDMRKALGICRGAIEMFETELHKNMIILGWCSD
ncbi:succinate semialdehyde dehydrogenase [Artemisia annua]|uniref:Succinate semialdehyde dehydrogenase n=1 Tax=Artemisia annua TaxID=35608 RepID=A0A2U1M642_ARTAN|nr:succinate semialdehyde dehydrogenase [Artemisia annua]